MIENQTDTRNETLRHVAALMMNAARTAPKARGIDNLEIAMLTGNDIERLRRQTQRDERGTGPDFLCPRCGKHPPVRRRCPGRQPIRRHGTELRLVRFSDVRRKDRTGAAGPLCIQYERFGHRGRFGRFRSRRPPCRLPRALLRRRRRLGAGYAAGLPRSVGHSGERYRQKPFFRPQTALTPTDDRKRTPGPQSARAFVFVLRPLGRRTTRKPCWSR